MNLLLTKNDLIYFWKFVFVSLDKVSVTSLAVKDHHIDIDFCFFLYLNEFFSFMILEI